MTAAEFAKGKAEWAERKANEAAASNAPWALANLRLYQNMMSRFLLEYYTICRAEGIDP